LRSGAKKLAMTTGGKLRQMAEAAKIPVFKIEYIAQPRAALGFSFIPTLGVLQKLGFVQVRQKGSHRMLRHPDGRRALLAFHSGDEIYPGTLKKLLKRSNVSEEDFVDLL